MNETELSWEDVKFFLAVARAGSLAAAGRALGVDQSTVQRRIAALEERLKTRLFDRHPRGYMPTSLAEELFEIAARAGEEIHAFSRVAFGSDQQLRGELRLTTVSECLPILCRHLAAFTARYPEVRLTAITDDRIFRLSEREAELAVRPAFARPTEADVIARKVVDLAFAPYASRAYLERCGRPQTREELLGHALIVGTVGSDQIPLVSWYLERAGEEAIAYRTNGFANQVTALRAGLGICVAPCGLCDPHDDLVRLFEPELVASLWLLYHRDLRQNARVRTLATYLFEALQAERELLEGRPAGE
jgi:DNA-binding transcriptional LysR family regulator